jgi:hypothetical protein
MMTVGHAGKLLHNTIRVIKGNWVLCLLPGTRLAPRVPPKLDSVAGNGLHEPIEM